MLVFTLITLVASFFFVLADPTPTAPGPNDSFSEGTNCSFAWSEDSNAGSTTWKIMNVELMSGSNFAMTHLTTVATNLDGTTTGTYSYPCPEVTPNSDIYFYQFSSPLSSTRSWTSRFTIADVDGKSTPPTEATQPVSGAAIPWGNGTLVDPSQAVPPPVIGGSNSSSSASLPSSSSSSSSSSTSTTLASSTSSTLGTQTSSASAGPVTSSASSTTSNAVGLVDSRAWLSVIALGATAFTFAVLL